MQPATRFLQGPANDVYHNVFEPLAKEVGIIKASKEAYSCFPFVKMRTVNEGDPKKVQVGFCIVDSSYANRLDTIRTGATKFCTETRNYFGTTVNIFATNWMWNCLGVKTALTLETAILAFCQRAGEIKGELELVASPQELQSLKDEITTIKKTLKSALRTVFYIYRTYNLQPDVKEEGLASSDEHQTIRPQYRGMNALIVELDFLIAGIDAKLNPLPLEVQGIEKSKPSEIDLMPNTALVSSEAMTNRTLVFKSYDAASAWFKATLARCRDSQLVNGPDCYSNLMRSAKIAAVVPQPFLAFAKTLDHTFKDKVVHYDTVQEICVRFKAIAEANGRTLKLKPYNNFKGLFKDLCATGVPREVYQDFFRALMNDRGTGPFGLQCEAALLNAVMNSVYFPMFDTEHSL